MNRKEAIQVLAILKAAYPNQFKGMTTEEAQGTISVWSMQFASIPADIVLMALNKHISTNKYPPTVADIHEKLTAIYWEAHGKAYPLGENITVPKEEQQYYERICTATESYRYKDRAELTIEQLAVGNNVKQLSEGVKE